jgi:hypothetical protein
LLATRAESKNIAVTGAILKPGLERKVQMNKEQMEAEFEFRVSMRIAQKMLDEGLLTRIEYEKLNRVLLQKYSPVISSLAPDMT